MLSDRVFGYARAHPIPVGAAAVVVIGAAIFLQRRGTSTKGTEANGGRDSGDETVSATARQPYLSLPGGDQPGYPGNIINVLPAPAPVTQSPTPVATTPAWYINPATGKPFASGENFVRSTPGKDAGVTGVAPRYHQ